MGFEDVSADRFWLKELHLFNFRRFKSLELSLHPQVTLLVGANGSGKTSVLEAAALLFGELLRACMETPTETRQIRVTDANRERQNVDGSATMRANFPVWIAANVLSGPAQAQQEDHLVVTLLGNSEEQTPDVGPHVHLSKHYLGTQKTSVDSPALLFLYRGTSRLWQIEGDQEPVFESLTRRHAGYSDALTGSSNTALLQSWMRWRELDRLQRISTAIESGADPATVRAPHMEAVQDAVVACLEGAKRFRYSVATQELLVEFKDGVELPLSLLSDGQRGLMALVADIAWRAVQLNPAWGREAPKKVEGVVLIDEIDLHKHPRWQRAAVRNLITAFPRLQFVITTHSPQVLGEARPEWVRVLNKDGTVGTVEHLYGKDSNTVLRDVMGAASRAPDIEERLNALSRAIADEDKAATESLMSSLEADLGANDPELVTARWELHLQGVGEE